MTFEETIKPYTYIRRTYEASIKGAKAADLKGEDADYFISKNCRAWFFFHYLRVEKELSDQATRSIQDSPIVQFVLSRNQLQLLDDFEKRIEAGKKFRIRVMKCRRAKVSTIFLAIGYHIVRFGENKKGLVFADKLETSRKLRRILDIFYLGDKLCKKPDPGKKTLGEGMYFHNPNVDKNFTDKDSYILLGSAEQKNSGIGGSLDFMHWSEASLSDDATTHWTTISPSLQGALFDIAESTPSLTGQDDIIFPEFEHPTENCDRRFISWMDIDEYRIDDPDKEKDFIPFADHHLYGKEVEIIAQYKPTVQQMLWRRFKLDELRNANAFRQVFPISEEEAFYSSAGLFFHKSLVESTKPKEKIEGKQCVVSDQAGMTVALMPDESGVWRVWKEPLYQNYMVVADTAEGKYADRDGRDPDYSTAIVFSMSYPVEECAILRERIPPEVFGEQIAAIAKYYRNAMVIPERNGPGLAMIVRLMQLHNNIYRQQKMQQGSFITTQDYGFVTSSTTKAYALSCLLQLLREKEKGLVLHSDIIRTEMGKFAQQGLKYGALAGYHDDTVSCLWLLAVGISQMPYLLTNRTSDGSFNAMERKVICPKIERHEFNYAN